jgi:hypothetical protein
VKFRFIAALLGLMLAVPAVVFAQGGEQYPDQQAPDQSKPSPSIPMPAPNNQGANSQGSVSQDQDSADQDSMQQDEPLQPPERSMDQGPKDQGQIYRGPSDPNANDSGGSAPAYNTPAPVENNGVARVSLIHGDVSTQRGDSKDWSAAVLNAPVLAGDRVSTGDKARTELELDYANTLRLSEHTQANIAQLTRSQIQIQIGRGMANYTVYRGSDADAEIDTPNVAIKTERRESSFRILVTADDHTEVLVRKGEIEVTTPQGGTRVGQGQFITIQGTGADEQYKIGEAPARDDWDQWNTDRDNMIRNSEARKRTNDYYVGTENLDGRGTWSEVPDYGPVWRPNVDSGWAPYRNGRWVYEPYWGWTWVSYDDWGWAPYHYGRWMYVDGGWGWWPGPAYGYPFYRPIWAPAYVSFFGFGGGFGFGVGFGYGFGGWGSVGWLPLGPCDRFHPWYGRYGGGFGVRGFGGYNQGGFAALHGGSRFSNVNLAMHNPNFRGGTTVSGREFGSGHMSPQAMTHTQFQNARFSTGRLPVSPSRESFSASGRAAAPSTTRNVSQNQHFFSAHGASSASGGRGFSVSETARSGSSGYNGRSNSASEHTSVNSSTGRSSASAGGREGGSSGGWQKFSPMAPRSSSSSEASRGSEASRLGESRSSGSVGGGAENRGSYGSARSSGSESRSYGSESRGYGSSSRSYGGSSRPPLNMRQPIVTQRSYGGGAYGRSAPSYGRPAPSFGRSAPSYGGGHSAPSFGGGHSAPSSHGGGAPHGGGGSHGGGGGHGGHGR